MQLLVVEDDDLVREVVTSGLADFSFQVGEAASAEEAVRLLCCGVCPPVVVTDIDLGEGWNGIELADWVRERWPARAVIFVTGRPDHLRNRAPDPQEALLAKPFSIGQLIALVRRYSAGGLVGDEQGPCCVDRG